MSVDGTPTTVAGAGATTSNAPAPGVKASDARVRVLNGVGTPGAAAVVVVTAFQIAHPLAVIATTGVLVDWAVSDPGAAAVAAPFAMVAGILEFEGGTDLSEGQWQKVAISRALMDEAPLLLILDEPTAWFDADAEHALFEHYASAAGMAGRATGAVTVIISHRFSIVRLADVIVVVDGGRIKECGSHEELMSLDGLYAELYTLQAQAYR